jgi:hypothetical protein
MGPHAKLKRLRATRSRGCCAPLAVAVCLAGLGVSLFVAVHPGVARTADGPRFSTPVALDMGFRVGLDPIRMATGDLDRDGHADLASTQWSSATLAVFLGKGTGAFARRVIYKTPRHPYGVAIEDVDGDGDRDVVTASDNPAGAVAVFANNGAGGLRRLSTYASSRKAIGLAAADLDRDGTVDLVTANFDRRHLNVLRGLGGGRFAVVGRYHGAPANDVALGDVNSDGNLDVALATNNRRGSLVVRLGNGHGSFGPPTVYKAGRHPWGVALADLNHDHHLDVAAASNLYDTLHVLLNRGDGTFGGGRTYAMGSWSGPDAVLVSDYEGDGHPDIATPSLNGPLMLRGRGDGTFLPPRRLADWGSYGGAVADFNGDAWPDLAFAFAELGEQAWFNFALINWTGQPAPPCVVPALAYEQFVGGYRLREAIQVLRRQGCRLGQVRRRYSRRVPRRELISQRPGPGEVLPSRAAAVDLVVSRGRRR